MSETYTPELPEHSQQSPEKEENTGGPKMWDRLAEAFGGYSQVPDFVVGMAMAGQMNNGGMDALSPENGAAELDRVVDVICERWEDQEPDPVKIRAEILRGMKEQSKEWGEDNVVRRFIESLEKNT